MSGRILWSDCLLQNFKRTLATAPLGPAVRTRLVQYGLSPTDIPAPSGPRGILVKNDVDSFVTSNQLQPASLSAGAGGSTEVKQSPYRDIELSSMRRTIAKRLVQSKSGIPHAYATIQCNIDPVSKLRKKLKVAGVKVSLNDFIIKCTANALAKTPSVNVIWQGNEIKQKGEIDISVAVATDSGLITPIVTNVASKDVIDISENIRELAVKARAGKLQPHEFLGGTFTISNLGMFGIKHFTAIINPPQCAILAVGGGSPVLDEDGKISTRLCFSLSYDARALMEEDAAKFLAHLKDEIETPSETSMNIFDLQDRVAELQMGKDPEKPSKS